MEETLSPAAPDNVHSAAPHVFGPRHVLLGSLTGFVFGIIVTLAFAPAFGLGSSAAHVLKKGPKPHPTVTVISAASLQQKITTYCNQALVYSSISGRSRLQSVTILPVIPSGSRISAQPTLFDATITFSLNPNPFATYQVRSAKADVFLLLQKLYSHNLPLDTVQLRGTFRFPKTAHSVIMLRALSDPAIASKFTWTKLGRGSEKKVWKMLPQHEIDSRFARYKMPKA